MKKNMYSIILSEDVVREIDRLAYENGTNRSNFIDGILAEYCRLVTPEMRIRNIFDRVLELCEGTRFLPSKEPSSATMTLRTSLEYKYHPTVKYDVQLFRRKGHAFGQLKVGLRSQSVELLRVLGNFFNLLAKHIVNFKRGIKVYVTVYTYLSDCIYQHNGIEKIAL